MFSDKAYKHAEACRFCWMCRHLCPVGLKTGKEVNTPRAKGLLISMEKRGFAFDRDTAQVMYECCLCGSCTNDCATGYEPPLFIREARTQIMVEGLAPKAVDGVVDKLAATGNMYGETAGKFSRLSDALAGLPGKAPVALYIGDVAAYRAPQMAKALISLLKKAKVDFTVIKDEANAGTDLGDLMGFTQEAQEQGKKCAAQLNASGAETIVVLDPYNAVTFKHEYPQWGCALKAQVVTATAFVAQLLKEGKLVPQAKAAEVTYHDSARLARDLDEHQPARDILAACGVKLDEMFLNKRMAKCCGSSIFKAYAPELALLTAQGRWEDAQRTAAGIMTVACPESYEVLAAAIPQGWELTDVFSLLDARC